MSSLVDANVHLWDQRDNPVFRLTDRTLVRDLLGDRRHAARSAPPVIEHLALLARHDLVATVEATSDQLEVVTPDWPASCPT